MYWGMRRGELRCLSAREPQCQRLSLTSMGPVSAIFNESNEFYDEEAGLEFEDGLLPAALSNHFLGQAGGYSSRCSAPAPSFRLQSRV